MDNNTASGDPIKTGNTAPRVPLMTLRLFECAKRLGRLSVTCPNLKIWSTCVNGVQTVSVSPGDLVAQCYLSRSNQREADTLQYPFTFIQH